MSCPQTTAQAWENCGGPPMGLYSYPGLSVPPEVEAAYKIVVARNRPSGTNNGFLVGCEANLRARGLIYMKSNPGDCGSPSRLSGGFGSGQIVGLSGQAASGVVGGIGAAGVISGPATLGISTAVSLAVAGIESIFAHHSQAVANEQSTICAVANYFNPLVKQLDNAVISGQITSDDGITYMRQICLQAVNGLQSIYKKCNAACYYIGYLKAHADFVSTLYPAISPFGASGWSAQAPGGAPYTYGNPPGAVQDAGGSAPLRSVDNTVFAYTPAMVGSAPPLTANKLLPSGNSTVDYLNVGYNQQTGQSAQAADVPSTPISFTTLLVFAFIIILVAVFL